MTIAQAIDHFDSLTCNQIERNVKITWLSLLDGLIQEECLSCHQSVLPFPGYDASTDPGTVLLVPHPYDEIYRWYLEMKTWDTLGEIPKYNNAAQKYNSALVAYMDYVNRTSAPQASALRLV